MRTTEQRKRHLRNLEMLHPAGGHNYEEQTRASLQQIWENGSQPTTINLRPGFVVRDSRLPGAMSDKDPAPATVDRPPLARLIAPRGVALRLELIALFVAQCGDGPNAVAHTSVDPADGLGWRHLVLGPSTSTPGSSSAATQKDNRVRQIKAAFDKLATADIGLVELPGAGKPTGRYDHPRLLVENGTRPTGPAARYRQPSPGANVVPLPAAFFLNGWVHVLDDAEIAAWLMFRHRTQDGMRVLDGEDRLALYTLRMPTWRRHQALAAYGLMDVEADPSRRVDGTMEERADRGDGQLHRFAMTDGGLGNIAFDVVRKGL